MKRSEINALMSEALAFLGKHSFVLPPYVSWPPEVWAGKGSEYDEIRDTMLGWDISDFGSGNFMKEGLLLITLRNGNLKNTEYGKTYAEKIMIVREEQITPMHFHWSKMEDIINRGGGNLMVRLYNADGDEKLADTPVSVSMDGRRLNLPAGATVRLEPGESISITQRLYHSFWGEKGQGLVLVGEVSQCNDDNDDNRFLAPVGRFPAIEEDAPPLFLMCTEYPRAF